MQHMISTGLNLVSAAAAVGAACLWWKASVTTVFAKEALARGEAMMGFVVGTEKGTIDIAATAWKSSRINSQAATVAGIAALLQALAIIAGVLGA